MIKNYLKRQVPMRDKLALILFTVLVLTSHAEQQTKAPVDPEKAELMGRVEAVLLENAPDTTLRRSLEWGPVKLTDQGHRSIRYKYDALLPGQERKIMNQVFVFDVKGHYLGHETLDTASKRKVHPFVRHFVTVDKDGGSTWQKAAAIKTDTWFTGHFSKRRDERWYRLEVSADVTYALFVDDENGSGKYSADPVIADLWI
ncbi:MAG: hypothetical protein K9N55_17920 [Phycisphaerae bacterium]|nr:hypothetical protein [Phycisphaerae bacterium]